MARTSALVSTSEFRASIVASLHVLPMLVQWEVQLVCVAVIDHAASAVGMARSSMRMQARNAVNQRLQQKAKSSCNGGRRVTRAIATHCAHS